MLNKFLILAALGLGLHAASILTEYRENGTKNIEKRMDLELTNTAYWYQHLKGKDTSFGYLESYTSILTCNKENSSLSLYQHNEKNEFTLKEEYSAFTGEIKGDKKQEGDLRTPLGIYDITQKITKLDSFYGPLAFVTSYPNTYDKYQGKNGSGIWIHGLPTEQERDDYTKGCIAINNDNIVCLDKEIDIEATMLIINPKGKTANPDNKILAQILAGLYEWRYSWLYNDTQRYLAFYSPHFIREDGMAYKNFIAYKTRIFAKNEKKQILFNDINVIPYPNTSDIFQISFKEYYKSNSFIFEGNKVLMIKLLKDNTFEILTEK